MPIVALAFHENIAMDRLDRYFAQPAGGETRPIVCSRCSLGFALVLVNRDDKNNWHYADELLALIEEDCINGLHRDEYVLNAADLKGKPVSQTPETIQSEHVDGAAADRVLLQRDFESGRN